MSLFDRIPPAFRLSRFRRDRRRDVEEEIDFYIDMRTQELVESGMDEKGARRAAQAAFGDRGRIENDTLQAPVARGREGELVGSFVRDLGQAIRSLRRRPGFTLTILGTLALGIGGSTTMFTVVNSVLFQPLPYPAPDGLVRIYETNSRSTQRSLAPLNYLDARSGASGIEHLAAYRREARNLVGDGEPERLLAGNVSANFFAAFGVPPQLGRTFSLAAAQPGELRFVILSHDLWTRRFGSDAGVVGTDIRLDGETVSVAGVMPPSFRFPEGVDLWVKALGDVPEAGPGGPLDHLEMRDAWYFSGIGRLEDGVSLASAQAELDVIATRIQDVDPENNAETGFRLVPLHSATVGSARGSLLLLLGAVGLVLLIACTNVANLMLVRATGRSTELGVRAALGAGRGGLLRHLVVESLVLGAAGAALGAALAYWGSGVVGRAAVDSLPRALEVGVDGWALFFAGGAGVLTVFLFGFLPALASSRTHPRDVLTARGSGASTTGARRLRGGLVVAETAIAVVLVLAAGLTLKSVWGLSQVDLGFETDDLAALPFMVPGAADMAEDDSRALYLQVVERVRSVPGVESAALAMVGPAGMGWQAGLRVEGREYDSNNPPIVARQMVSQNYFAGVGIEVVRGRGFQAGDGVGGVPVAVVNEAMAELVWLGESPIGQRINTGLDGMGTWVTVVGVAGDTRNRGPVTPVAPEYYRPMNQAPPSAAVGMAILARTTDEGRMPLPEIQQAAWSINADMPFYNVRVEDGIAAGYTAGSKFMLGLLGLFALVALLLGAVGIHGVTAYSVEQRRQELGIRAALGADRSSISRMVIRQSVTVVGLGLALGILGALAASRLMQGLLHEVRPTDPATYVLVALLFLGVAVVSALVPAFRASRVDPVSAMRAQ
ncbi:MAG: ADOP family duplicated permease [Longimicrobiales bacterium]